jgi:hypothetical protein
MGRKKEAKNGYYMKGGHAHVMSHVPPPIRTRLEVEEEGSQISGISWLTFEESLYSGPKGLLNVGNTCYANATLQCLLNTALTHALTDPKASAIFRRYSSNPNILAQGSGSVDTTEECSTGLGSTLSQQSSRRRRRERGQQEEAIMYENCQWLTDELRILTRDYHAKQTVSHSFFVRSAPPVVNPGSITRHPHRLSHSLTPYQQEDAHEFLRALLGTLVMHGQNKELSSLFDGLLESSVTCQFCFRPSLTRDRYMDLSLDIAEPHVSTLNDALDEFTATEELSGDNAVYCRNCECKRTAIKGLRLATAPSILVCHIKRFAFDEYGRLIRLKKHIQFPVRLEIGDYMSRFNQARPPPYELVAVLVHQGVSCDSGHYLAYVKHANSWYMCNDSIVEPVELETVLSQQAYILLYEVAEMREKHGFSVKSPRKRRSAKSPKCKDDIFSFTTQMLCGVDYATDLAEMCHLSNWRGRPRASARSHPPPRRATRKEPHDDLSTLGDSTVETTDTMRQNRFKRSASSGNLREKQHQYKSRSASMSGRRKISEDLSQLPTYSSNRKKETKMANPRSRPPPRPPRPDGHKRFLSSEDVRSKEL